MDDPEGWGRLNLFDAADGYGALSGNVVLVIDAVKGGFHASDRWRNDITGSGKPVKQGNGTLALTGNNSWSGGTQLEASALEARSGTAFGAGDVYVSGGRLIASAAVPVAVRGRRHRADSDERGQPERQVRYHHGRRHDGYAKLSQQRAEPAREWLRCDKFHPLSNQAGSAPLMAPCTSC